MRGSARNRNTIQENDGNFDDNRSVRSGFFCCSGSTPQGSAESDGQGQAGACTIF